MAEDPIAELLHRTEDAVTAVRKLTEQLGAVAVGAAEGVVAATRHPAAVSGSLRRGLEDAVDLGVAWVEPVRRLSEEQRRFSQEAAIWAERNRQFAEEVAAWAEAQQAFAERLESWTAPFLSFSEELGATVKTVTRAVLPTEANGAA